MSVNISVPVSTQKKKRKTTIPLIIEPHPVDYVGFPFVTLVQYRKVPMLVIVDNMTEDTMTTFVLDLCRPEDVDEEALFKAAANWYNTNKGAHPISIEFARVGLTQQTSKIYRALSVEFISRVIGPVSTYNTNVIKSVKRRRRKPLPVGVEVLEMQ